MEEMKRDVTCGALRASDEGRQVTLNGWVHRTRDHGGVHFLNVRDRYGITQVVVGEDADESLQKAAETAKLEYCIAVHGTVRRRPSEMVNRDMLTGEIELLADRIETLSPCATLPFMVDERSEAREETRLKYRYLDMRSFSMQRKIALRSEVSFRVREYLRERDFHEIETPTMIKSTPEGARDFLVPSRLHRGKFYAMPQSPQLYKQILMVSGFDRYFQIAHCFRDEDARGDRQLEHTQIDIEMSFVSKDDIFKLIEGMMEHVFLGALNRTLETPFPRIAYHEAMNRYGSDKPDLRFDLEIRDGTAVGSESGFRVFEQTLADGGAIKALVVPGGASISRKQIDELEGVAKTYGAKGLAWCKVGAEGLEGGISKFIAAKEPVIRAAHGGHAASAGGLATSEGGLGAAEDGSAASEGGLGAAEGDLVLFVADTWKVATTALGAVRSRLGHDLDLIDHDRFAFAWIVDFPLFEWDEDNGKWEAAHHMFTMPQEEFIDTLEDDPGSVKGDLYDLVCNGYELASGSIRIHNPELQQRIFDIVGFSREEAHRRFGFLMDAFRYGPPPHGGIAPGLDRLLMILAGEESIREVIAFPKTTAGISPMDESPSSVDEHQLKELGIRIVEEAKPDE